MLTFLSKDQWKWSTKRSLFFHFSSIRVLLGLTLKSPKWTSQIISCGLLYCSAHNWPPCRALLGKLTGGTADTYMENGKKIQVHDVSWLIVGLRSICISCIIILMIGSGGFFYQLLTYWSYKREGNMLLWSQLQKKGKSAALMFQVARFASQTKVIQSMEEINLVPWPPLKQVQIKYCARSSIQLLPGLSMLYAC